MKFLKSLLCFTLVAIIVISFVSLAMAEVKPIKLVGATYLPEEHIYYRALVKFADSLKEYYSGPLDIEVHHSGDLGSAKDFFEFMIQGISVDFAMVAPAWMSTWVKKADFMDTPFLFRNIEHWNKALTTGVFKPIEKDLIDTGVRAIGYAGGGTRNMILSKPIYKTEDLPKVLMRVMGSPIQARVFNATGIQATPLAYLEVYNAIKLGVIDGLENEASALIAMKFYEVAPYVILTKHSITTRLICFSEKKFQSFPKELQEAILKAGAEAGEWARDTEVKEGESILKKLADEGKITLIEFDNTEMRNRALPVIEEFAKELDAEDIFQNIRMIK